MRTQQPDREGRFRALYAEAYADVLAFAQRRGPASQAEDVTAEAFLVVWRRFEEAPRPDDVRAWIFGIARHCLLNAQRGRGRQDALAVRIASVTPPDEQFPEDTAAAERLDLAAAWKQLSPAEQETLSLTVFEDLGSAQAARVLGITAASYRIRLMRARRALRRQLAPAPSPTPLTTPLEAQS